MPFAITFAEGAETAQERRDTAVFVTTPRGGEPLERLSVGAEILTRDAGPRKVVWLGRRLLSRDRLEGAPELRPVRIRAGALGPGLPERDLVVSPQTRVAFADARTLRWFGPREVPIAAIHLTCFEGIEPEPAQDTTYIHPMFVGTQSINAEGVWLEAARVDDEELGDASNPMRQELLRLYPELVTLRGWSRAATRAMAQRQSGASAGR